MTQCKGEVMRRYALVQDRVTDSWSLRAGSPIPAANLLRIVEGGDGLRFDYDLPTGIRFAGIEHNLKLGSEVSLIGFTADSERTMKGVCLLLDDGDEWHRAEWMHSGAGEMAIELSLDKNTFSVHWKGDENGVVNYPLRKILIGSTSGRGRLGLSDLYFEGSAASLDGEAELMVKASSSSAVFRADDSDKSLHVYVHNRMPESREYTLVLIWHFADGRVRMEDLRVQVPARQTKRVMHTFVMDDPGYASVDLELRWQGASVASTTHAVASVPSPAEPAPAFDRAFFGMCFFPDVEAAQRMGVRFVRQLVYWNYVEVEPGEYYLKVEQALLEAANRAGLGVILTAVMRKPPDWAPFGEPDGFLDNQNLVYLEDFLGELTDLMEVGRVPGAIEIQNEPDIALMWLYGYEPEKAARIAGRLLETGYAAIKAIDPERTVLGIGMSGKDFRQDLAMTRALFAGESVPPVDYFATHPYTLRRYVSEPSRLRWPDSGFLENYWEQATGFAAQYAKGGAIWSTELGWATLPGADLHSAQCRRLAAVLSQAMVLSKAQQGVEKFTWFAGQIDWLMEGYDYALFRLKLSGEPSSQRNRNFNRTPSIQ